MTDITVVIPYCNGDIKKLEATLDTVAAQTCPADEVIVVNDGSDPRHTAALMARVRAYGLTVLHQSNSGPASARNLGAEAARGHWIAFLDADDLWHRDKLALQRACALEIANAGKLIMTHTETLSPEGERLREVRFDDAGDTRKHIQRVFGAGGNVHSFTSTLFLEREAFWEIGGFDPALRHREDQHFLIKAFRRLGAATVPRVLSSRVIHPESYSARTRNVSGRALMQRQIRFANAVAQELPAFRRRAFLAREALRIGKRKAADRALLDALAMSAFAVAFQPTALKGWMLAPAALAACAVPGKFRGWHQDTTWSRALN